MRLIKFGVKNLLAVSGRLAHNQINFDGFMFKDKTPGTDDFYKREGTKQIEFELELGVDAVDLEYINDHQKVYNMESKHPGMG
jgi:hypothetical protein